MNEIIIFLKTHAQSVKIMYVFFALLVAILYGCYAIHIFISPDEIVQKSQQHWSWRWHQFWVNAVAQLFGWSLGYYVFRKALFSGFTTFNTLDYVALMLTFLGITGDIPTVLSKWQPKT